MRGFQAWDVRQALAVMAVVLVATGVGCHDLTAPEVAGRAPTGAQSSDLPSGAVVVSPENLHGWSFVATPSGTPCTDASACSLVTGPATPPLGTGSAELASGPSAPAFAYTLPAGTRLRDITALRYAAYQQSAGDGAMTLQLNVEYDLSDHSRADVGHVVHLPRSAVPQGSWTTLDAREGLWWSDRQGSHAGGVGARARPCVRAAPCSWAELLARFPNMGVDSAGPNLLFAASASDSVRGNVDDVVIGVGGVTTEFDFEKVSVRYRFQSNVGEGVISGPFPADTLLPGGSRLTYSFTARAGRAEPVVVLDDTLAAASGTVVMDGPHAITVVSDTIYSLATLTPLEARVAEVTRNLLTSGDKVAAAQAFDEFLVAETLAGTNADTLARAAALVDYLLVDPQRDSAQLTAIDDQLAGLDFNYYYGDPTHIYTWVSGTPSKGSASSSVLRSGGTPVRRVVGAERSTTRMTGVTPPAKVEVQLAGGIARVSRPEDPQDYTAVIFTNGIFTQRGEAMATTQRLAMLLYAKARFANHHTTVMMHYSPTRSVQMAAYYRAHPCLENILPAVRWKSPAAVLQAYGLCMHNRAVHTITSGDLVEAFTARVQAELQMPPTNDEAMGLARIVAAQRKDDTHVILVGHSEGTIIQEEAVQQLPALEKHPLQAADRCVAVLALAPATSRDSYGMDEYHLKGLLANEDIIRLTHSTGWDDLETPLSAKARAAYNGLLPLYHLLAGAMVSMRVHEINGSYLSPEVAPIVIDRITTLHKECVPGAAQISLSTPVVPLGGLVTAATTIWNQNGRASLRRKPNYSGWWYLFDQIDSVTFKAMAPDDGDYWIANIITTDLAPRAPVKIPLLKPPFAILETLLWKWDILGAGNGPGGTTSPVEAPTEKWDGTEAGCNKEVTYHGVAGNWVTYQLHCNRAYSPIVNLPDTLVTGRKVLTSIVYFTTPAGATEVAPPTYYYCVGPKPCFKSGWVDWIGEVGIVARSAVVSPTTSASTLSAATTASSLPSSASSAAAPVRTPGATTDLQRPAWTGLENPH